MITPSGLARASAAVGSAAAFGLIAAPLLPFAPIFAAPLMAIAFGFFFLLGTGHRILIAVIRRDFGSPAGASWTGASTVSTLAVAALVLILASTGGNAGLALAAHAAAINTAYLLVKLGCHQAGCCRSERARPGWPDLRMAEAAVAGCLIASVLLLLSIEQSTAAGLVGVTGHLAVRVVSRRERNRLPQALLSLGGRGQELVALPLLLATGLSAALFTP